MRELAKRDPSFADTLKKKTYAKLGRDHPDLRAVRPCPVPLVIVGNKYDIFKVSYSKFTTKLRLQYIYYSKCNLSSLLSDLFERQVVAL